jgi:beta-ureidopropionase / N-carbamoyl-L-amino-acid hydrolase
VTVEIDPGRFLSDLQALRRIGAFDGGVERLAFGADDRRAREWLLQRFRDAGLDAEIDGIGNVYGRWPGATRTVLTGSHSDTVPCGGWLDGALGVIASLEAVRAVREVGAPPGRGVDLVSFADEEGTFRGTLGSSVFSGEIGDRELDEARNSAGTPLRRALADAGWAGRELAQLDPERQRVFLELHVEQGPRLEAAGIQIGVVTTIVGIRRVAVSFDGRSDHAGTTPMAMRRDAGAAAIRFAARTLDAFERQRTEHTVWNIGSLTLRPGAGNVVSNRAEMLVEYRDATADALVSLHETVERIAREVAAEHGCPCKLRTTVDTSGVDMDPEVVSTIEAVAADAGAGSLRMPSGAGHDAMVLRRRIPAGMLFVPSRGGRSHDPAEDTDEADLVTGARVLARAVERLIAA